MAILRVARAEVTRYARLTDRRVLVGVLVLGIVIGATWPIVQQEGLNPEEGLFQVSVSEGSPLRGVVESDPALAIVGQPPATGLDEADLVIQGDRVVYDDSPKSRAAAKQLENAARAYWDRVLADEPDQEAAYPVRVDLVFRGRSLDPSSTAGTPPTDGTNGSQTLDGEEPSTGNATGPNGSTAPGDADASSTGTQSGLLPSEITPPFPMKSLLYTFAYLIPLTFVGELYGGSVFAERVRSRGLLLLSTPVSRGQLLLGKSLPYIAVTVAIAAATTVLLGAGLVGFAASLPIIAFALASSLLIGILAPSQRALTFLLVSTNVLLSTFLFLPAIFTEVPPVAFLSPVGLIAASIRGEAVGLGALAYGTVPLALVTVALAALAVALFREETLFAPGGSLPKLVDGLARLVQTPRGFVAAGILAVPIALALELFVLVFAVTLGLAGAFTVFLIGSAFVEEALKALPSYAHGNRAGTRAGTLAPWIVGPLVGCGFFLGEKGVAGLGLLGFGLLPQGTQALATFGVAASPLLVLAPLLLHAVTATVTAGASRGGKTWTVAGWVAASLIHAGYNATVILLLSGGGLPW